MYAREIDGRVLTLSSAAWLYDRTFVLYNIDEENPEMESMWYHIAGTNQLTCIGGFYAGRTLPELPSTLGAYSGWNEISPNSKVLIDPRNR